MWRIFTFLVEKFEQWIRDVAEKGCGGLTFSWFFILTLLYLYYLTVNFSPLSIYEVQFTTRYKSSFECLLLEILFVSRHTWNVVKTNLLFVLVYPRYLLSRFSPKHFPLMYRTNKDLYLQAEVVGSIGSLTWKMKMKNVDYYLEIRICENGNRKQLEIISKMCTKNLGKEFILKTVFRKLTSPSDFRYPVSNRWMDVQYHYQN